MAPTPDDLRDLRWLLRILNRSSLEARYPQWREADSDGALPGDEAEIDGEEDDAPSIVHVNAATADDAA
jgi:hypothetical protein